MAAVERLGRLAEAVQGLPDGEWFALALRRYIENAPAGLRLEEAFEVAVTPGASPWWSARLRAERDDAIRALGGCFSGTASARALATAEALRRYGSTGWRHDRARGAPLTSDDRRKFLFKIFTADENPPTSMRRIYDIITSG